MTFKGRKKTSSVSKEKKKEQCLSDDGNSCRNANCNGDHGHKHDNINNVTADYGIILVKKYQKLRSDALLNKAKNDPNHRGLRPKPHKSEEPDGFINYLLAAAFCGSCGVGSSSANSIVSEETGTVTTAVSEETSSASFSSKGSNAILLRQNQFKEAEEQRLHEESILTDVSFLSDGSPTDLELQENEDGQDMPISNNNHRTKLILPAFRKKTIGSPTTTSSPGDASIPTRRTHAFQSVEAHT